MGLIGRPPFGMRKTVSILFGCLLCISQAKAASENFTQLLQGGVALQHAVIPLYKDGSAKLSALVRVDKAYVDYERRGFFRIGMLPVVVLDGATIEAEDTNDPMSSLAEVERWVATKTGQRVEMRRVKIIFSPGIYVEAGLAQCRSDDHWDLLKGVHFVSGAEEGRASRGVVVLTGARAGQVILDSAPRQTRIFQAASTSESTQTK